VSNPLVLEFKKPQMNAN